MSSIILSGYYGFDNLGDEAILMALTALFKTIDQDLEIIIISGNPALTEKRYQVPSVNRNNILEIIKAVKKCDLFISGGGSLLQDITGRKSIPFYLGQVFLAQMMGKKTAFFAQGIGPVKSRFYQRCIKYVMNRSDYISVRDADSRELLLKWGVNPEKIRLTADPVFVLKNVLDGLTADERNKDKALVGVSVRPWASNDYLVPFSEALAKFAGEIEADIMILPLHRREDLEISNRLKGLLAGKFPGEVFIEEEDSPLGLLKKYQGIDFFWGVRLHSIIFSVLSGIPFIAVDYDPKIKGFLDALGINSSVGITAMDSGELYRVSMSLWDNHEKFKKALYNKRDLFAGLSFKSALEVYELIKDSSTTP
ncbi:MAG: polysaccharide pyruvyl transferase CsaB [Halanaerobiaceae bacterium]|jgi:polysaccharide pyruvyl transferase CsaB|nr:polysaccharide pyruvyl transferase CsaB [Halanaerobiaceae bacterium]